MTIKLHLWTPDIMNARSISPIRQANGCHPIEFTDSDPRRLIAQHSRVHRKATGHRLPGEYFVALFAFSLQF